MFMQIRVPKKTSMVWVSHTSVALQQWDAGRIPGEDGGFDQSLVFAYFLEARNLENGK